jgi:hypothetical protein
MGEWIYNGVDISPENAAREYARDNYYPQSLEEELERRIREIFCLYHGIGCAQPESL